MRLFSFYLGITAVGLIIIFSFPLTSVAIENAPAGTVVELTNPIGGKDDGSSEGRIGITDLRVTIGNIIAKVLEVVGSLAFLAFVYGGFMWLTAAGNADRVQKGSTAMLYATIGLFVIFGAYAILNTILQGLSRQVFSKEACVQKGDACRENCVNDPVSPADCSGKCTSDEFTCIEGK